MSQKSKFWDGVGGAVFLACLFGLVWVVINTAVQGYNKRECARKHNVYTCKIQWVPVIPEKDQDQE